MAVTKGRFGTSDTKDWTEPQAGRCLWALNRGPFTAEWGYRKAAALLGWCGAVRCATTLARNGPDMSCSDAFVRETRMLEQRIHGRPPRAGSTTVWHEDLSFLRLGRSRRIDRCRLGGRLLVQRDLAIDQNGPQGLDDHQSALTAGEANMRGGLPFKGYFRI